MNSNQDAGVGRGGRRTVSLCCVGWGKESIMILNRMCSLLLQMDELERIKDQYLLKHVILGIRIK